MWLGLEAREPAIPPGLGRIDAVFPGISCQDLDGLSRVATIISSLRDIWNE
jgi:hypothetical protein